METLSLSKEFFSQEDIQVRGLNLQCRKFSGGSKINLILCAYAMLFFDTLLSPATPIEVVEVMGSKRKKKLNPNERYPTDWIVNKENEEFIGDVIEKIIQEKRKEDSAIMEDIFQKHKLGNAKLMISFIKEVIDGTFLKGEIPAKTSTKSLARKILMSDIDVLQGAAAFHQLMTNALRINTKWYKKKEEKASIFECSESKLMTTSFCFCEEDDGSLIISVGDSIISQKEEEEIPGRLVSIVATTIGNEIDIYSPAESHYEEFKVANDEGKIDKIINIAIESYTEILDEKGQDNKLQFEKQRQIIKDAISSLTRISPKSTPLFLPLQTKCNQPIIELEQEPISRNAKDSEANKDINKGSENPPYFVDIGSTKCLLCRRTDKIIILRLATCDISCRLGKCLGCIGRSFGTSEGI